MIYLREETEDFGTSIFFCTPSVVYCNDAKIPASNIWSSSACVSDAADCGVWGDEKESNWVVMRKSDSSTGRGWRWPSDLEDENMC